MRSGTLGPMHEAERGERDRGGQRDEREVQGEA